MRTGSGWAALLVAAAVLAINPLTPTAAAPPTRADQAPVVPAWANAENRVGDADPSRVAEIQVVMRWRDPAALARSIREVSTPGSSAYGDYLTPATFRSRFAPLPREVDRVEAWLRGAGLEVGSGPENHLFVPARGTLGRLAQAFGVTFGRYRTAGTILTAPDMTPNIPIPLLATVAGVRGLDQGWLLLSPDGGPPVPLPLPDEPPTPADTTPPNALVYGPPCSSYDGELVDRSLPRVGGAPPPAAGCGTTVAQLRAMYGLDRLLAQGIDGRGQTIVITGSHAIQTLPGDLATWSSRFGLPTMKPGQLTQLSYPGAYQTPVAEPILRPEVWAVQAHMLCEYIHAAAPGANILYYGSTTSFDLQTGTAIAVDAKLGDVVVNGWYTLGEGGGNAADVALVSQTAQQAAMTGISVLFASGSVGDNTDQGGMASPEYPANDPMVTAVGATSAIFGRAGLVAEVGWAKTQSEIKNGSWKVLDRTTYRGSGGGTSTLQPQPDYQAGVVPDSIARRADGTRGRAVPDVAVMGDPETGLNIGLTQHFPDGIDRYAERHLATDESATGLFAAVVTLLNQRAGMNHGFLNRALYGLYRQHPEAFNDVVPDGHRGAGVVTTYQDGATPASGLRRLLKTFEQFRSNRTAVGYDTVTGLGSPTPCLLDFLGGVKDAACSRAAAIPGPAAPAVEAHGTLPNTSPTLPARLPWAITLATAGGWLGRRRWPSGRPRT
ncbi:MAG: S53 family peptidase [Candidatus Dormibacteria bacterium]